MAAADPIPGTSDIWEPDVDNWVVLEAAARDVFGRYGYGELRTPVFERTDIFVKSIGTETDVVQKEMYTFEDRGGRSLTLRPEGTAGVIRAVANVGLSQGEEHRVFYLGPMFRGERPAAGRKRQFHQVGVEAVGPCLAEADAECIAMLAHYLDALGITGYEVLLNTRGVAEDRTAVAGALQEHFRPHLGDMCEDCQRRFDTNIWRILDCKAEACQAVVAGAPDIVDLVGEDSRAFFRSVCASLDRAGIAYRVAPRLVRGLDYYVHTVFEVVHSGLGAQDALAGGGRYRIPLPGGRKTKYVDGVGFAAGMERLLMAREGLGVREPERARADVFLLHLGQAAVDQGLALAQALRRELPGVRVLADYTGRSMKAQMRTANRLGARLVLIRGEDELSRGVVVCKDMVSSVQTDQLPGDAAEWIRRCLAGQ